MNYGFENFVEKAREATTPWVQFGDWGFDTFEKAFQLQAETIGDVMDLAVDQLRLAAAAENPAELIQAQSKLAEEYVARAQKRGQAIAKIAAEAQQSFATWAEKGFRQAQAGVEEAVNAAQANAKAPRKSGTRKAA